VAERFQGRGSRRRRIRGAGRHRPFVEEDHHCQTESSPSQT
jgi:hypothetical protein